jgi:hypothetical protein
MANYEELVRNAMHVWFAPLLCHMPDTGEHTNARHFFRSHGLATRHRGCGMGLGGS